MPPHDLSRIMARSLIKETATGMAFIEETVTRDEPSHASSTLVLLATVLFIVVVTVLIIALLLARKFGICRSSNAEKLRPWPGQKTQIVEKLTTEKPEPTFVQRHLEMLRAWQKPTIPAQPPLPLYPGRAGTTCQPRRPTGISVDEWEESFRNVRPMGPAYWKKYGEEMEARKSWWEKTQDCLRTRLLNIW